MDEVGVVEVSTDRDAFSRMVAGQFQSLMARVITEHKKEMVVYLGEIARLEQQINKDSNSDKKMVVQVNPVLAADDPIWEPDGAGTVADIDVGIVKVEGATAKDGQLWNMCGNNENHSEDAQAHQTKEEETIAAQFHRLATRVEVEQLSYKKHIRKTNDHNRKMALYEAGRPMPQPDRKAPPEFGDHHPDPKDQWNWFQRVVFNTKFELASGAIIMGNTIVMALQMEYTGFDAGFELSMFRHTKNAIETWPHAEEVFDILNMVFSVVFLIELILRILANHWHSIKSGWIWFDFVVVSVGFVDTFAEGTLEFNPGMMRALRLVRLVRVLKVFQAMSTFDSLFLLLKALNASKQALVWSFIILGMVQLITGLFLCQLLQEFVMNDDMETTARRNVYKYFGSFSRTILTMFEITLGNWVPSCRTLVDNVNEIYILFYVCYRCMFCFAVLKVIAAVFITETNRVLESDSELQIMKHDRAHAGFRRRLIEMFQACDPHKTGKMTWRELDTLIADPHLQALVTALGFAIHDFEKLFWLLDDGSGEIEFHEFVNKMEKLKGESKTIDTLTMLKLIHRVDQKLEPLLQKMGILHETELEKAEEDLACRV